MEVVEVGREAQVDLWSIFRSVSKEIAGHMKKERGRIKVYIL